ncbi:MAG: DUF2085 domain-containing protein [Bacteroidota bacterium]
MKRSLDIIIIAASMWIAGFVVAPFLAGSFIADILYRFYGVVCHQFASRSIVIHDHSLAVCARCSGIYIGFLAGVIAVRMSQPLRKREWRPVVLLAVSVIPMVFHVAGEMTGIVESSLTLRVVTGAWFGAGISFLLHRSLTAAMESLISIIKKRYELTT